MSLRVGIDMVVPYIISSSSTYVKPDKKLQFTALPSSASPSFPVEPGRVHRAAPNAKIVRSYLDWVDTRVCAHPDHVTMSSRPCVAIYIIEIDIRNRTARKIAR